MATLRQAVSRSAARLIPPLGALVAHRNALRAENSRLTAENHQLTAENHQLVSRLTAQAKFHPVRPSECEASCAEAPEKIAERLERNYACLVRGAFPADRVASIRALAEEKMERHLGGNHVLIFSRPAPDGAVDVDVSVLLHVLRSPCLAVAKAYFAKNIGTTDIVLPLLNLVVRKYDPTYSAVDEVKIPWHQDAFGFPPGFFALNCWTLMGPDECGMTSPGLEFILDRFGGFVEKENNPTSLQYHFLETSHARLAEMLAVYDPWRPSIRLGDVMIFTELAMHRTYLHAAQSGTRYSAEVRLVGRSREVIQDMARPNHPHYLVSGDTLHGPARVRQMSDGDGNVKVLREDSWAIAN
jgi:hypothetical protein